MDLGDRVKELREKAGLTQEELAEKMGVQRNTVWRWENKKANLRADNIQRLSTVLNIDASEIMTPEEDKTLYDTSVLESKRGIFPSLAYWGEVADNARLVAKGGQNLSLIYTLLSDAAGTIKTAMSGKALATA